MPLLFTLLLQVLQLCVRHQLEERLERDAVVDLVIPTGELVWAEPGEELLVKGELFDIKTIRYEGSLALVTGIFDHQESRIIHLLQQQGAASGHTESLAGLFGFLQQFVATRSSISFLFWGKAPHSFAPFASAYYTNPSLPHLAHPPQV